MNTAIISSKFQMAFPKSIREPMGLYSGQSVRLIPHGRIIEIVPIEPMENLAGILKGMDTRIVREKDREL